ncbi:MAG: isoprenylcysteine carboxylmethyltransferase family protein [Gemmatimonadetes bacterium]|nr:isoprenylcysteine carboxylmethyltransferase family protein [Gemmatimonadota bacterium]
MSTAIFAVSLASISVIVVLGLASVLREGWRFWPPPSRSSAPYHLFWWSFRVYFVGLILLSVADFARLEEGTSWWRLGLGIPLLLSGFGLAIYGTGQLGWENAHGVQEGLKTDGMYRWSRNPIYVVTIPGLLGLGLLVHSLRLYALLAIWAVLYFAAPFLEEPWLEERYGEAYRDYRRRVPRFLGWPRR